MEQEYFELEASGSYCSGFRLRLVVRELGVLLLSFLPSLLPSSHGCVSVKMHQGLKIMCEDHQSKGVDDGGSMHATRGPGHQHSRAKHVQDILADATAKLLVALEAGTVLP